MSQTNSFACCLEDLYCTVGAGLAWLLWPLSAEVAWTSAQFQKYPEVRNLAKFCPSGDQVFELIDMTKHTWKNRKKKGLSLQTISKGFRGSRFWKKFSVHRVNQIGTVCAVVGVILLFLV